MEDLGNIMLGQQYENIRNIKLHDLLQWSYEIACGMEFLASKKVIHGDLAARNVFLTRDFTAKIGDFGLSRQLYHYSYYTKTAVTPLPLKWLAIECLQNFQFSVESDIWAFGITLYEIFSIGEIPYSSVQMNGEEFLRALKQGMRLSKPVYCPIDVFGLMMKCWKNDKKQRPNFKDIVNFFHSRISVSKQDVSSPSSLSQSVTSHQRGDEGEEIDRNGKSSGSSSDVIESTF
ncbi:unnamed protein product [Orchesella dallaii]|uniref:Protein kinase domain-containing protein n=1 Tax=Orchesella dallaii TaxID=48710 RepID=A0ABP1QES9_9HEXA